MVNGLYIYSTFLSNQDDQSALHYSLSPHLLIHTHSHTELHKVRMMVFSQSMMRKLSLDTQPRGGADPNRWFRPNRLFLLPGLAASRHCRILKICINESKQDYGHFLKLKKVDFT